MKLKKIDKSFFVQAYQNELKLKPYLIYGMKKILYLFNKSIVKYWVQFLKILYCIGIVLYWPNTYRNCIVYCIV